jgi:hypothetical protein
MLGGGGNWGNYELQGFCETPNKQMEQHILDTNAGK